MPRLETSAPAHRALRHPTRLQLPLASRRMAAAIGPHLRRALQAMAAPASDDRATLPPVWQLHGVGVAQLTLSFSACPGEIVHLRGGSPLARLRLLAMAAGFAPAASGRCEILGRDLRALDDHDRRALRQQHIACVLAGDHLPASVDAHSAVTALDCVARPLLQQGLPAPLALARARRALDRLCAGHLALCALPTLSPAQARLVLLARALAQRPLLLVLEHPETGLAPPALSAMRQALWALAHDSGTCVVMTTEHAPLMASADHVLDLDGLPARHGVGVLA